MNDFRYVPIRSGDLAYTLALAPDGEDPYHRDAVDGGHWNVVQDCLLSLISAGDTVLDIGANIGTVTMPVAAKGARVIAYEALPDNVRFLDAAVRANRFEDRITVRNVAVWEKAGRLSFTGGSAWGRVVEDDEAIHEAVAIDADLPSGTTVKAVKIDVEGSELHVLRGMRRLLESQRPHVIFESNTLELGRLGSSVAMIFRFLEQYGYRLYRIYGSKRLMKAGGIPQEMRVSDFLATPLGPWRLRRLTGKRVGSLRARHIIRRLVELNDQQWEEHLHLLAIAERLPARVRRDKRVAAMTVRWRERYRDHPLLDVVRRGQFDDPGPSPAAVQPRLPASE